jgi:hypothetical protein
MEPDMARTRSSNKKAYQLLQPTAELADMLAVALMSKLLADVGDHLAAKKRKQAKNRKAQAARARVRS